jgi:hypothetical protein
VAVALCCVDRIEPFRDADDLDQLAIFLQLVGEPFSPPVPLLEMKRSNPDLANVRAFQPGFPKTLYDTTAHEAETILRACRVDVSTEGWGGNAEERGPLAATATGGGFGSAEQNARVERAAIAVFKSTYCGWK